MVTVVLSLSFLPALIAQAQDAPQVEPPLQDVQPVIEPPNDEPRDDNAPMSLLGDEDELPWAGRRPAVAPPPIARRPESAEQMLRLFDIDESVLRSFIDGRPLHEDENESLINILFALTRFGLEDIARWADKQVNWQSVLDDPDAYRTKMFHLTGQVQRVERIELIPEVAERFQYDHYFKCLVKLDHIDRSAVVCVRRIPKAWAIGQDIDESVSFDGMFLKLTDQQPVLAAIRLAWHPNRIDENLGITKDHVFLGDLGMDVGLWDDVDDKSSLLGRERECFYQLLAAVGRTRQDHLRQRSGEVKNFADLMRHPQKHHGQLLYIKGVARRASKILVDDRDIVERFGIDHYYEIYVFVDLDTKIVFRKGDKNLEYSSFPVVFCTRRLPKGMSEGDIFQEVAVPAVYFKLWAYESRFMSQFDPRQRQPSPMLVALVPDLYGDGPHALSPYIGMMIGGLFIVALLGVWFGVWRFGREDARFARETLKRQFHLEEGKSLNEMGLEARGEPDFSGLD